MGNVINSCPNNKILLSSIKLKDPTKSCLNCSKIGYQLNSTSSACICATGFYSNNNICYPISCSATGYLPNPNDNTMLQLVPLPYNIDFIINPDATIKTNNNDIGYFIVSTTTSGSTNNIVPFNNSNNSNLSVDLPFDSSGNLYRNIFSDQNKITTNDGKILTGYNYAGEYLSISLPYKINLKKYKLTFLNNNFAKKFYILGANLLINDANNFNNNRNWYLLDYRNLSTIPVNTTNTQQFLYNKYIDNTFYFYRTASDTCATDPTKNNIKIIPTGFKTNFTISNIGFASGILLSIFQRSCTNFNGIRYLDVTKISNNEYKFDLNLNQIIYLENQYELKFLKAYISY